MSKLLTIGMQYMKEVTGNSQVEIDPAYEDASNKFDTLTKRLSVLTNDVNAVLQIIPTTIQSSVYFAQTANSAMIFSGNYDSDISKDILKTCQHIHSISKLPSLTNADKAILNNVWKMKTTFETIEKLRSQRKKTQLLCDSTRDNLISLQKKSKNDKLLQVQKEYNDLKYQLQKQNEEFIVKVNGLWEKQYEVIQEPLIKLLAMSYALLKMSVDNLG